MLEEMYAKLCRAASMPSQQETGGETLIHKYRQLMSRRRHTRDSGGAINNRTALQESLGVSSIESPATSRPAFHSTPAHLWTIGVAVHFIILSRSLISERLVSLGNVLGKVRVRSGVRILHRSE